VVGANNDVTLTSSNVVSTAGTSVLAGHNVITDAAAEHTLSTASKDVKKSGIMGAGMGIMIGKKQSKDNYYIDETTHKATTLGSTDGKVTVQAGDTVHLTTTDIIADKGIRLSGQDIVLDGKEDHYLSKESHEYKSSGLTVSLGGSVASAINTAYGLQQKAKGREDKRLAALEYMEAGKELKTAASNIHDYTSYTAGSVLKKGTELKELGQAQLASAQELKNASLMNRYANTATANVTDYKTKVGEANISKGNAELADLDNNQAGYKAKKRAKADNLVNIRVSIGSSSSRSESSYEANTFDGGSIESNGDIIIEANSADSIKGNIKAVGETISGKTVKLVASNDVSLQAATNTSEKLENAKSKGWSVGANISVAGGGILGFDASANAAKQKSNTKVTTHTGTTVVGSDAVTITSGKDTHISGSKVIGKSVTADVGGNLSIESLQDTKTYVGESSNKGFSVSTNAGSLSNVSMSSSKGKMKSDYASVTDQAGIYAGDGGFVINTAKTTSLRGAVIDSTADSNKNKLSTKSLDVKDVENTAEYTSRNVGMSYNHVGNFKKLSKAGKDAVWNTLGTLPNLLPDSSKSSSSTTKSAISNGTIEVRDANFNMQTLSRDTKDNLNKLDEIFDKKKIEERQELSKLFAKEAFGQLHNWNPTSKEGKAAKAIAHGVVAEVSARMAGNKPGSGFYAGATNEALIGEIQKIAKEKPDVAQSLSALLGAAVNGSLGYSPVTGAAEARYGTKWNLELDYHAATVRQSVYEEMKRHYNSNYLRREILSYSPDEITEAKENLEQRLAKAESSGAFAGSVELLGFFLDQSPSKHGIIDVDYTSNGYPIYIFGENSAFTQALKDDYELNKRLVALAIKNRDNSGVDMPTDFDSTQFYTNSFDTAVGLGEATYIITYKKDYINRRVEAKITITDDYDFSKEDAQFDIYKSAYILQASRERRPYAYKATYDMEFPLSDVIEVHRWEG
jgi:filamentous hemagglutinin